MTTRNLQTTPDNRQIAIDAEPVFDGFSSGPVRHLQELRCTNTTPALPMPLVDHTVAYYNAQPRHQRTAAIIRRDATLPRMVGQKQIAEQAFGLFFRLVRAIEPAEQVRDVLPVQKTQSPPRD